MSGFLDKGQGVPVTQPLMDQMTWNFACRGLLWVTIDLWSSQGHVTSKEANNIWRSEQVWPQQRSHHLNLTKSFNKTPSHLVDWRLIYRHPLVKKTGLCSPLFHTKIKFYSLLRGKDQGDVFKFIYIKYWIQSRSLLYL